MKIPSQSLPVLLVSCFLPASSGQAASPLITSLAETGGDLPAISARYTGQVATNTAGLGVFTVGYFGEDVPAYTDRVHQWNGITNNTGVTLGLPSYLAGGEYVVIGNDNRDNVPFSLTLTFSQPVNVYLLIDNRGGPSDGQPSTPPDIGTGTNRVGDPFMNWVLTSGFTPVTTAFNRSGSAALPDEVGIDDSPVDTGPGVSVEQHCSVYWLSVSSSVTLGEYGAGTGGRDMYGVVVTAVPEPTSWGLVALGGIGVWRALRRRLSS